MARRILPYATGASTRLVRYLLAGRVLRQRMYATTPVPFLRRLHLIADEPRFDALSSSDLPDWWSPGQPVSSMVAFQWDGTELAEELGVAGEVALEPVAAVDATPRIHAPGVDADADQRAATTTPVFDARRAVPSRREPVLTAPPSQVQRPARAFRPPVVDQPVSRPGRRIGAWRVVLPRPAAAQQRASFEGERHRPLVSGLPVSPEVSEHDHTPPALEPTAPVPEPRLSSASLVEPPNTIASPTNAARHEATDDVVPVSTVAVPESQVPPPVAVAPELSSSAPANNESPAITAPARRLDSRGVEGIAPPPTTDAAPVDRPDESAAVVTTDAIPSAAGRVDHTRHAVEESPQPTPAAARRRGRVEELPNERPAAREADTSESPTPVVPDSRRARPRRPAPQSEQPREREGDRLFLPVDDGVDRSPAIWAARLAQAMRPATAEKSAAPAPARGRETKAASPARPARARVAGHTPLPPKSTPPAMDSRTAASEVRVPERTRRFLKPLVGVDPADVTIVQGPAADQVSDAHQADALAIGHDTIIVKSDFVSDSPRDVGLLAHELTHVARERRPRFIPPAARPVKSAGSFLPGKEREETVARRVEARAIALAQDGAAQRAVADAGFYEIAHERPLDGIDVTPADQPSLSPAARAIDWGGLPAPWEPLPEWINESAAAAGPAGGPAPAVNMRAVPAATAAASIPVATTIAPVRPAVHAAESARVLETPERAAAPPGEQGQQAAAPDIDKLARQVYAALKRRLEADARRERMFRG